ncbi:MAG: hypothetical protein CM1200mP3_07330 [Chloroflexota bacterium]|nr:MAG: hypothetical protein CM1200mP3_07330 [Chloroflexota bacterium]
MVLLIVGVTLAVVGCHLLEPKLLSPLDWSRASDDRGHINMYFLEDRK